MNKDEGIVLKFLHCKQSQSIIFKIKHLKKTQAQKTVRKLSKQKTVRNAKILKKLSLEFSQYVSVLRKFNYHLRLYSIGKPLGS